MNFQVAVLCDAATETYGKLSLLGAFDTICTRQLPAIHPACSIALRMTFTNDEEGAHELHINFVDEDGKPIMPGMPPVPLQVMVPDDTHFVTLHCIVSLQQFKFDKPGLYSIDVSVDGRQRTSVPLLVKYDPPKP